MYLISARNVNDAFPQAMSLIKTVGVPGPSRNGSVIYVPKPVITQYSYPTERVVFSRERDANPFFHFMEGLWMLGGKCGLDFIGQFNSQMKEYANPYGVFDGAYGGRWRYHFGHDQLNRIIDLLKKDPHTRRAVLTMWDGALDLGRDSLDIPCNTHAYLTISDHKLNMTVCCRSNDAIWGAYGANVVHMSMMMEVVASLIGCGVGTYYQLSNNLHIYPGVKNHAELLNVRPYPDPYESGLLTHPLVNEPKSWFQEVGVFLSGPGEDGKYSNFIFSKVANPMYLAWQAYKRKDYPLAREFCMEISDQAWRESCRFWIDRRS